MANMSLDRIPMPHQPGDVRNKNFDEVALGYTKEDAMAEASRCLQCKNAPCVGGCPVGVKIPQFIDKILQDDLHGSYQTIAKDNSLPAICGRVCPQENQCEGKCVRGIKGESVAIGRLERFVADWHLQNESENVMHSAKNGHRVAIVGSGPAGLSCAGELAKMGYAVDVFEAFHTAGGVLVYGIPEFRLPKQIVTKEVQALTKMGVNIHTNRVIGKTLSVQELLEDGYKAVFIGSGAGLPLFMNIPGENLNGVYSANEFLTRINLMKAYEWPNTDTPVHITPNVAVIGGGNVTMDAARAAKRLGAENVYVVYRRSEAEMPARLEEIHHAKEEGIRFCVLTNPTQILGNDDGWATGMECIEMELGQPDASGRLSPVPKPGSEHILDVGTVIIAIGQTPNPLIKATTQGLDTQKWGGIVVDEATCQTSIEGVYAGGDAVTGAATVILAMGAGKTAAKSIDEYIKTKKG